MLEYEVLVERCRTKRLNQRLENASISHATILFKNLFIAAANLRPDEPKEVRLQCERPIVHFFERYSSTVKALMDKGVNVRLLVGDEHKTIENDSFLQAINGHGKGEVRVLSDEADTSVNFIIVSNFAYRIENDSTTMQAVANFNDPITATVLCDLFEKHWKDAIPLGQALDAGKSWRVRA